MKYNFKNETLDRFTALLSEKSSVPGGGGAAALIAAAGAALSSMTANFTVGKEKYTDVNDDMVYAIEKAGELRERFLKMMDEDAEAFSLMSKVYRMPKTTDEEIDERSKAMEEALKTCAAVPVSLMEACCEAIELSVMLSEKGSELLISDAGCSSAALGAALRCAYLNVCINTSSMRDRAYAEAISKRADELLENGMKASEGAYEEVLSKLRG